MEGTELLSLLKFYWKQTGKLMSVSKGIDNQLWVGKYLQRQYSPFYLMFPEIKLFLHEKCVTLGQKNV